MENFYTILNKNTKSSALALKDLLGIIELEPIQSEPIIENGRFIEQRPHYNCLFQYRIPSIIRPREQRCELVAMAEEEGFEPPDPLLGLRFSKPMHSAALPLFHKE